MSADERDEYQPAPVFAPGEVEQIARNLARNCGYRVFPCGADKKPTCRHGCKDATSDPAQIFQLWRAHPGPLIGVATGEASGIDVLDLDFKHETARAWFSAAAPHIPATRAYRTRAGGRHLYFRYATRVRNTASKLAGGVDTRGDGGYVIAWFAAGLPCEDPEPPADWPGWLLELVLWQPAREPSTVVRQRAPDHADRAIEGVLRVVSAASQGERNAILYWGARRLGERIHDGALGRGEAAALLVASARAAGLLEPEARRTIASAWTAA